MTRFRIQISFGKHSEAPVPAPRSTSGTAGQTELDNRLSEIGLTPRTGWYTSIALYGSIGSLAMLAHLIQPENFNFSLFLVGAVAVMISILSVAGLRYFPESHGATHLRLIAGASLLLIGAITVGEASQPFLMAGLVVSLPPAIYYGVRTSIPYMIAVGFFVAFIASMVDEPWSRGLAVCSAVAVMGLTISMQLAQAKTRSLARRHRRLAFSDPLTGLANMRALHKSLRHALTLADNHGPKPALFAIDLDDFKLVNDRFNHAVGDAVLKAVADELSDCMDDGDLCARRGGDEFSVLVCDRRGRDLDALTRNLSKAIERARNRTCPDVSPTGSVAYVAAEPEDDVASILQRADDALHIVKSDFHRQHAAPGPRRLAVIDERSESARAATETIGDSSPLRRRDDSAERPKHRRFRGSTSVDRPLWFVAAAINLIAGAAILAVSLLGFVETLAQSTALIVAAALFVGAGLDALAALRPLPRSLLQLSFAYGIVLLTIVVSSAGPAGAALLDLYALFGLLGFHMFTPAVAARHLIACIVIYGVFAIGSDYPFGEVRTGIFATMMISAAVLMAKVRAVTAGFIQLNHELSQIDGLTSLANVRAMRSRTIDEVTGAARSGHGPTIFAIDLDEFKLVNDSFSHSVGDQVLIAVARSILENVRGEDLVARRGGDEFVVVTSVTDETELTRLGQRIGESILRSRQRICPGITATASINHVSWRFGESADELMHRADVALHDRKVENRRRSFKTV